MPLLAPTVTRLEASLAGLHADDDPDGTESLIAQRDAALEVAGAAVTMLRTVTSEMARTRTYIDKDTSAADDAANLYALLGRLGFPVR